MMNMHGQHGIREIAVVALVALAVIACGKTEEAPGPSPVATAAPAPAAVPTNTLPAAAVAAASSPVSGGQGPRIVKQDGHVSPLSVTVVSPSGDRRDVLLLGFGDGTTQSTHVLKAADADLDSEVTIWLDEIREIKAPTNTGAVVMMKNGKERKVKWRYYGCTTQIVPKNRELIVPDYVCSKITINSGDSGGEKIDLSNVRSLQVLGPARTDSKGNAMLDVWGFSPFTGEQLPPRAQ